jgi:hypothetical protein
VLEDEHAQCNFGRRSAATATTALRESTPQRIQDPVDERIVVQGLVDATKPRIHLLLRLEIAEP